MTDVVVVSPYYRRGSLVLYLKSLKPNDPLDMLAMIRDIALGMLYLHTEGVLHGDLKVQWPSAAMQ